MKRNSIYDGAKSPSTIKPNFPYEEGTAVPGSATIVNPTDNVELIMYVDCDKPFTLMEKIIELRSLAKVETSGIVPITIYIVQGKYPIPDEFEWRFLWEYMSEMGGAYNIMFRGFFPRGAQSIVDFKSAMSFNLFLHSKLRYEHSSIYTLKGEYFTNHGVEFEII